MMKNIVNEALADKAGAFLNGQVVVWPQKIVDLIEISMKSISIPHLFKNCIVNRDSEKAEAVNICLNYGTFSLG